MVSSSLNIHHWSCLVLSTNPISESSRLLHQAHLESSCCFYKIVVVSSSPPIPFRSCLVFSAKPTWSRLVASTKLELSRLLHQSHFGVVSSSPPNLFRSRLVASTKLELSRLLHQAHFRVTSCLFTIF